jgi:aspartate-semialdehyde dehydrogenase
LGKKTVAVLAATGMVGQRYVSMLSRHPFFEVTEVTGYDSAGKKYIDAVKSRGEFQVEERVGNMVVRPTKPEAIDADLVFSPLPTEAAQVLEPKLARKGLRVITDASPHRMDAEVPLIIPEINPEHLGLVEVQRERKHWDGLLVATPNCTAVGLAMFLKPIDDLAKVSRVVVSTMQAVSGAGYPGVPSLDVIDNVIPYIKDEEEKVESEPLKILGRFEGTSIRPAKFKISAMCHRVATTDGHMESAYLETEDDLDMDEVRSRLQNFAGLPQKLRLPAAPRKPIIVTDRPDRPQVKLDRYAGSVPGMSVVVGRIRRGLDKKSLRVTFLSHNTIRGAAGSTILAAELMQRKGLLD